MLNRGEQWTYIFKEILLLYNTQPSQTCSGGFIKTQLYAICCCFFAIGEYNLI